MIAGEVRKTRRSCRPAPPPQLPDLRQGVPLAWSGSGYRKKALRKASGPSIKLVRFHTSRVPRLRIRSGSWPVHGSGVRCIVASRPMRHLSSACRQMGRDQSQDNSPGIRRGIDPRPIGVPKTVGGPGSKATRGPAWAAARTCPLGPGRPRPLRGGWARASSKPTRSGAAWRCTT